MLALVQNKDNNPLSPCHPARARLLLKQNKAKVITKYPFTIRLTYQIESPVFLPTRATLDDGKTSGIGVVQENNTHNLALCRAEMLTRGEQISDNLKTRKSNRSEQRNRRNRNRGTKGEPKIHYRIKNQEYPPSIRADVEAKVNAIKRLMKLYPITEIVLEPIKIDIVKTIDPTIKGNGYRQGLMNGINATSKNQTRRLAILGRDGYRCLYCGTAVTNETACIHHFVQRKHSGSARFDINGTLCVGCHTSVTTEQLALAFDTTKYPNIRSAGRAMHGRYLLENELSKLGVCVIIKHGYETSALREVFGLPKTHGNDALVLGCNPAKKLVDRSTDYKIKLCARHNGRKLFDSNLGIAAYRSKANKQPHVDAARMKTDDHDQAANKKNCSYRRHIRRKYNKTLQAEGKFNYDLLPGKKQLNEIFTVNRAILLLESGPVLIKNQRITTWKYPYPWPDRNKVFERYDTVKTSSGALGIITSLMSNGTVRVDFFKKRTGYGFRARKPRNLFRG